MNFFDACGARLTNTLDLMTLGGRSCDRGDRFPAFYHSKALYSSSWCVVFLNGRKPETCHLS